MFASLFRSSPDIGVEPRLERQVTNRNYLNGRPKLGGRTDSNPSSASSDDGSVKMEEEHHRKHSFHLLRPRRSERSIDRHHGRVAIPPATLGVDIESPPLVFYGQPSTSSGALLSGQLKLNIVEDNYEIESFEMKLVLDYHCKKPYHSNCPECALQTVQCTSWKFLQGRTLLSKGEHNFPFSYLLPGHLPASMDASMARVDYNLQATLVPRHGQNLNLKHSLAVRRAIQPTDHPRQSIRIFPPTNLTAHVTLPSIIHPIGEFTATLRLDGIIKRNVDTGTQTHWKLKRLSWKVDEVQKFTAPACPKHAIKAGCAPGEKTGVQQQEVRTLNSGEMKSGWKSDYNGPDGCVELEFPFSIRPDAMPVCDTKGEDGTEVSHHLVVEMIVAEEYAPIEQPSKVTPTGAARVLRMHFSATVTERSGMGISWDEESPPLYENVPASPPGYGAVGLYEGTPIPAYEEMCTPPTFSLGTPRLAAARGIAGAEPEYPFPRFAGLSEIQAEEPEDFQSGEGRSGEVRPTVEEPAEDRVVVQAVNGRLDDI